MGLCDFNCPLPRSNGKPFCCEKCSRKSREFFEKGGREEFTDEEKQLVRSLFDEQDGFWSFAGCKLPGRLMPTGCVEFDCKNYVYIYGRIYDDGVWKDRFVAEAQHGQFLASLNKKPNYKPVKM